MLGNGLFLILKPELELVHRQLFGASTKLMARQTRRPRYACRSCAEAVVTAEAPARPIDGGMPTEALIVYIAMR